MPPKSETAAQGDTLSPYIVAKGHTIDGKMPGDTVNLSETDAERLLGLGFLLDEEGNQLIATGAGPAVNVEDGVEIKPV